MSKGLVFISYAREDIEKAERLERDLVAASEDVWLDTKRLLPGEAWEDEINAAIRSARYFVTLLSQVAVSKRSFFRREVELALRRLRQDASSQLYVVPARLDEVDLTATNFKKLHWVDMFPDWDVGVNEILRAFDRNRRKPVLPLPIGTIGGIHLDPGDLQILNVTPPSNLRLLLDD